MRYSRADALRLTGTSEAELARLEQARLVVPERSWRDLWLRPSYHHDQLAVIRWLVDCHRAEEETRRRERSLGSC